MAIDPVTGLEIPEPIGNPNDPTLETVEPYVAQSTFAPAPIPEPAPYNAPDVYRPDQGDTVAGQMTGLLDDNSKYIQNARKRGEEYANTKGLLSSSIGAKAGETAAIESALPIAQQDSQSFVNAGTKGYEGQIQGGLAEQNTQNQANLVNTQGAVSSQLGAEESTQKAALNQIQNDFNTQLKGLQLSSEETKAVGSSVTLLGQTLSEQIAQIQTDPSMDAAAKTAVLEDLTANYRANVDSVGSIYGVTIEWADEI